MQADPLFICSRWKLLCTWLMHRFCCKHLPFVIFCFYQVVLPSRYVPDAQILLATIILYFLLLPGNRESRSGERISTSLCSISWNLKMTLKLKLQLTPNIIISHFALFLDGGKERDKTITTLSLVGPICQTNHSKALWRATVVLRVMMTISDVDLVTQTPHLEQCQKYPKASKYLHHPFQSCRALFRT